MAQNANLTAELAALKAELAAMKAQQMAKVHFKVSDKGAVSVYGLGRFPVTLYGSQWDALLAETNLTKLRAFIEENRSKLSVKAA